MDSLRKVTRLAGFLFLIISSVAIISAQGYCDIIERDSCTGNILMGLSGSTNAHGELWNQGNYGYVLCCDFEGNNNCTGSNKILGLFSEINAHAEIPEESNYETEVCYGDLECRSTIENCSSYEIKMLSLSSETNAHIGGFNDYDTKICCKFNITELNLTTNITNSNSSNESNDSSENNDSDSSTSSDSSSSSSSTSSSSSGGDNVGSFSSDDNVIKLNYKTSSLGEINSIQINETETNPGITGSVTGFINSGKGIIVFLVLTGILMTLFIIKKYKQKK